MTRKKFFIMPRYPLMNLSNVMLMSVDRQQCCSAVHSQEKVFYTFVVDMLKELYPLNTFHVMFEFVMSDLTYSDMDISGRFFVIDNLSHLKRVQDLRLIEVAVYE